MFYQIQPNQEVYFRCTRTGHNNIKTHLHSFFELHCCITGQLRLEIGGKSCILQEGEAALIFPYQPHSYSKTGGKGYFFTFDPELIAVFARQFANMLPVENRFPFTYDFESVTEESDVYTIKSFLYAMCSCASRMEYTPVQAEGRVLLEKILLASEAHFHDSSFSLGKLSDLLGYDYGYLSKYFLQKTGIKFGDYLNQRRVSFAVGILARCGAKSIGDLALACGFGSIRSFNRNFKEIEGLSPQAFIKHMCANGS